MGNETKIIFDNDASASSFGWNFQANAGIFLLLHYIKDAKSIKIESKYEDIEICLKNKSKIFAQAKSVQSECNTSGAKNKMKDAILSLGKVPVGENDILIYISNIREPIGGAGKYFENKIVKYDECLDSTKTEIDNYFREVIDGIEQKMLEENLSNKKKTQYRAIKKKLESMNIKQLEICSIYPYYGEEENRYSEIRNKIIDVLANDIKLDLFDVRYISQRLLEHWQLVFEHNSTIKDGSIKKKITKEDFIWPIAVFLSDINDIEIDDCMSMVPDNSLKNEAQCYLSDSSNIYHERFEFVNKVLRTYENYKRILPTSDGKSSIEKSFIREEYKLFWEEYMDIEDEELREYVLKINIYKIIMNNRKVSKISKEVNI